MYRLKDFRQKLFAILSDFSKSRPRNIIFCLFCSKFFTDHFSEVHFGLSGPTYAVELLEILFFLLF